MLYRTPLQVDNRLSRRSWIEQGIATAVTELVVLSTCNRMEFYAAVADAGDGSRDQLTHLVRHLFGEEADGLEDHFFFYEDTDVVGHLATVAAGLDSQVLGESQILGQVSTAFNEALAVRLAGTFLSPLFRMAIRTGKRARTETDISKNPASISSVALALAEEAAGPLQERQILLLGAGAMGRLSMKALHARGIEQIAVANRSHERAALLVGEKPYPIYALNQLDMALVNADIIISATGSSEPVINAENVRSAQLQRAGKAQIFVDIAVPRDIAADVRALAGVRVFDIDDLQGTLDRAQALRQREVPQVRSIIDEEMDALAGELRQLAVKPLIVGLRRKAEVIRQQALARSLRHIGDLDPETLRHVQHLSRALVNQLLHDPTVRLKSEASNGHSAEYAAIFRALFALEEEEELLPHVRHDD